MCYLLYLFLVLLILLLLLLALCFSHQQQYNPIITEHWTNKSKIPLIMHRTGPFQKDNIPKEIKAAIEISCQNLGVDCRYYDDSDCEKIIQQYFPPETLQAYQMLIPTAYKADLFRYCVLYLYGGIYSDLSQTVLTQYDVNQDKADLIIVKDRHGKNHGCGFKNNIQVSFLATIKKHPFFQYLIQQLTKDILSKRKGICPIDVSGPTYFGRTFCRYFGVKKIRPGIRIYQGLQQQKHKVSMPFRFNGKTINFLDKKLFIQSKSKNHKKLVYQKGIHYHNAWKNNNIFK